MSEPLRALYEGDVRRAQEILPDDDRLSVFEAAAFGRAARLLQILSHDPSQANALSEDGFTPLHLAVFGKQEDAARILAEHGADLNKVSAGPIAQVPPLGTAAFVRSSSLARVLLDVGADVNVRGAGGFTALHTAAQNGDEDLVRLLLDYGADPNATMDDGTRPSDLAERENVRALLEP